MTCVITEVKLFHSISTNERLGEIWRENMISSHLKITCYLHARKDHIINRTLHDRLEIRNSSSRVETYFTSARMRNLTNTRMRANKESVKTRATWIPKWWLITETFTADNILCWGHSCLLLSSFKRTILGYTFSGASQRVSPLINFKLWLTSLILFSRSLSCSSLMQHFPWQERPCVPVVPFMGIMKNSSKQMKEKQAIRLNY